IHLLLSLKCCPGHHVRRTGRRILFWLAYIKVAAMPTVRQAAVDGLFYSAAPDALQRQVADCLDSVATDDHATQQPPKLLIAPHPGYIYSGDVAAHAYVLLGGGRARTIRRVVLLGPAHRVWVDGLAAPEADAFETPLGRVDLDTDALAAL